jgi:RNA polymerase sigma-70 factor (ECF subfamily)
MIDDAAFAAWVIRSRPAAMRLANRLLATDADASDAVQESYVRAYVALREERFRSGVERLDSWLMRIVSRVCIDALRRRRRLRETDGADIELLPSRSSTDRQVEHREVEAALSALPEAQRTAFVLREIEGFTLRESAELLGCTEGAVEQRVLRAWTGLRRRFDDE